MASTTFCASLGLGDDHPVTVDDPATGPRLQSPPQISPSLSMPSLAWPASLTWTTTIGAGLSPPRSTAAIAARSPTHGLTSLA